LRRRERVRSFLHVQGVHEGPHELELAGGTVRGVLLVCLLEHAVVAYVAHPRSRLYHRPNLTGEASPVYGDGWGSGRRRAGERETTVVGRGTGGGRAVGDNGGVGAHVRARRAERSGAPAARLRDVRLSSRGGDRGSDLRPRSAAATPPGVDRR